MRKGTALLLAVLVCLSLCGCEETPVSVAPSPSPSPEPSIVPVEQKPLVLGYDPTESLHPITGENQVNRMLTSLIYEGLYRLDETFAPQAVLAGYAEVDPSGLIWTISVVEDRVFSDGTPMTAAQVASSLNTARKSSVYASRLKDIVSVRASGSAVTITLSQPNGALTALLDIPVVLETENSPAPLGTGRYRYAQNGEDLYLMANYNREGEVPYATIGLCPVSATDERIAAFDSGRVNVVTTDFLSPYALGYSCDYEIWSYATTDMLYVGFRSVESPCEDAVVRQAFARSFDRVGIVRESLSGYGDATTLPVSPLHEDWDEKRDLLLSYDLQSAADLLGQAGYTRNEEDGMLYRGRTALSVVLIVNSDNIVKGAVADRLAETLNGLGVSVDVRKLPWKDYVAALEKGEFDLYIGEVRLSADFDLTELLAGSLNYGGYDATTLLEAATKREESSGHRRYWLTRALWEDLAQEVPFAPLCFKKESMLVHWNVMSAPTPIYGDLFYGMDA